MAKLPVKGVQDIARQIVAKSPGGIRYSDLVIRIHNENPETPKKTVQHSVWNLQTIFPEEITKPSRGLFTPVGKTGEEPVVIGSTEQIAATGAKIKEADFYEPFAEWLRNEDEVNWASILGGSGLRTKWGTPDVVGTYKPLASNLIKFPIEIVAAEIKVDPQAPVVAFGQAVAYRLFATKTYLAMPVTLTEEDQGRLESLCMLFGIGLVIFELDKDTPNFSIRMRAQRFAPDMFYVNEFAERLKFHDAELFEKLFG